MSVKNLMLTGRLFPTLLERMGGITADKIDTVQVVYGWGRFDVGTPREDLGRQVDDLIVVQRNRRVQDSDIFVCFDIVCNAGLVERGDGYKTGAYLLEYIKANYPDLIGQVVGVTDDEKKRPAFTAIDTKYPGFKIDYVHTFILG